MLWPAALATVLLVACQLSTEVHGDVIKRFRRGDTVAGSMRRYAEAMVEARLEHRQSSSPPQTNVTEWNQQITAACNMSLMVLNGVASNPAGMAVCYNLPYLDNSTGVFQADLRLYMISDPSGDFSGIPAQNVTVGLQYFGASVQSINLSELMKRDFRSWPSTRNENGMEKRAVMTPSVVQSYAFIGQINKNLITPNMNTSTLQGLVIPVVTLSAVTPSGKIANTTLASNEATFVNGVFADAANTAALAASAASASAAAAAAAAPFVLPGTKILIFPIGAIVTGVWALLGVGTVAYGTVGRIRFRDYYRGRVLRAQKKGLATI